MTEKTVNKLIGKNVRRYRLLYNANVRKLTQAELAEKIGVSTALIGALESDKSDQGIGIYNLLKISEVLNVPINKFFEK